MYDAFITGVLYISLIGLLLMGIIVVVCTLLFVIRTVLIAVKRVRRRTKA